MGFFDDAADEMAQAGLARTRMYVRVDEISTTRQDHRTLFDAVDADWLDSELPTEAGALLDAEINRAAQQHVFLLLLDLHTFQRDEGRFAEVVLGEPAPDGPCEQYFSLTGAPVRRRVERMTWLRGPEASRLASLGDLGQLPPSSREDIERVLARPPEDISAVAVYDVGQGALAAAISNDCPVILFDAGAGCDANRSTFPPAFDRICVCADPPVVLSHFHHDHWAAVARFPELLSLDWIVPRQGSTTGFAHAVLVGAIRERGRVFVWPNHEQRLASPGGIEVLRCSGTSRNDSGLAVAINGPSGGKVLLPGDARYKFIGLAPGRVTSLVVAHHGGRTGATDGEIPSPDGSTAGRLVYSYGPGNTYQHPLPTSARRHETHWEPHRTRATADRGNTGLGHVHLYWSDSQPAVPAPNCPARRAQRPCQR